MRYDQNRKGLTTTWKRVTRYAERSDTGYQVSASKGADGWRYSAWAPALCPGWSYRAWADGRSPHWSGEAPREHYALGESIPHRVALIGIYDSAQAARAACEADAEQGFAGASGRSSVVEG